MLTNKLSAARRVYTAVMRVHRAGEHLAYAAVTAVRRVAKGREELVLSADKRFAPEIPHDKVRAYLVTEQIARAEVGTHPALDAGAFGLLTYRLHGKLAFYEQRMIFRKNKQISRRFRDDRGVNCGGVKERLAHHWPAEDDPIALRRRNGGADTFAQRGPDRNVQNAGRLNRTGHREIFFRDRPFLQRVRDLGRELLLNLGSSGKYIYGAGQLA